MKNIIGVLTLAVLGAIVVALAGINASLQSLGNIKYSECVNSIAKVGDYCER